MKYSKALASKVLFDTQVYIAYGPVIKSQSIDPGWYSVVVWQERMASVSGGKELRNLETACKQVEKEGRLLVPDREAWLMAGRILNHYLSDLSRQHPTRSRPALSHNEKQNLIRDVLRRLRQASRRHCRIRQQRFSDASALLRFQMDERASLLCRLKRHEA